MSIFHTPKVPAVRQSARERRKKFIQNDGSKQYRISTHPNFITFDRDNLLKHTNATAWALAKKLPKDDSNRETEVIDFVERTEYISA